MTRATRIPHKHPKADIRRQYRLTLQIGLIASLGILLGVFNAPLQSEDEFQITLVEQESVQMEEIQQTQQEQLPPPPPKPSVPIAVADETVLDEVDLDLDASLDLDEPVTSLPAPPPPPPKEEAKEEEVVEDEIFVVVEQMPELIGGIESIQKLVKYPEIAQRAGITGRVFVQFVVDEKGNVTNPQVIRGIGGGCDEEAIRVVSQAKFKPGMQRGKPVRVRYVIPLLFTLKDAGK